MPGKIALQTVMATTLRGAFLVLRQAAQCVVHGGRIMALSRSMVAKALPAYGPYIASTAGVERLVHVLAHELHGRNVTVNAVAPGPVATELFLHDKTPAQIEQCAHCPHWNGWANRRTSRTWCPSWRAPTGGESTARCCVPLTALPNASQGSTQPDGWEHPHAECVMAPHRAYTLQRSINYDCFQEPRHSARDRRFVGHRGHLRRPPRAPRL